MKEKLLPYGPPLVHIEVNSTNVVTATDDQVEEDLSKPPDITQPVLLEIGLQLFQKNFT